MRAYSYKEVVGRTANAPAAAGDGSSVRYIAKSAPGDLQQPQQQQVRVAGFHALLSDAIHIPS